MQQLRHFPSRPPPRGRQNIRWSSVCMQRRSGHHKTSTNKHALHRGGFTLQWRMETRDLYDHDAYCANANAFCAFAYCEDACPSLALTTVRRRKNLIATPANTHLRVNTPSTVGVLRCDGGWKRGTCTLMTYIVGLIMLFVLLHAANMHVHLRH